MKAFCEGDYVTHPTTGREGEVVHVTSGGVWVVWDGNTRPILYREEQADALILDHEDEDIVYDYDEHTDYDDNWDDNQDLYDDGLDMMQFDD